MLKGKSARRIFAECCVANSHTLCVSFLLLEEDEDEEEEEDFEDDDEWDD